MSRLSLGTLLTVGVLSLATPVLADNETVPETVSETLPEIFRQLVRQGMWREQFMSRVMEPYRQADRDNDGLSGEDLTFHNRFASIQSRVNQVNLLVRRDLDGDGQTSAEEIGVVLREEMRRRGMLRGADVKRAVKREVDRIMKLDRNKDGTLTMDEALALDEERANDHYRRELLVLGWFMARDPNGDGILDAEEMRQLAIGVYGRIDSNDDKMIDQDEYRALVNVNRQKTARKAPCDLPRVTDNAGLVLVGAYRGSGVASVAIGDGDGRQLVTVQKVVIEPGADKLYLVFGASQPVIWSLTGAVERVSRAVVIPQNRNGEGSGVVGVPGDRVSFLAPGNCNAWFVKPDGGRAQIAMARISGTLDRPVGAIVGMRQHTHSAIHLPSGERVTATPPNFSALAKDGKLPLKLLRDMWNQAPGGYVTVDADVLTAAAVVRPHPVRPGIFGVADLVESGHLIRRSDGMLEVVKPFAHFPAALPPAYSRFLFPDSIPTPKGAMRGIRIWSKETGEPRDFQVED